MSAPLKTALEHFNDSASVYEDTTGGCTRDLARYIVSLCPPLKANSTILDNACGTGIVTEELLGQSKPITSPLTIWCVDGAPAMIDIAQQTFQSKSKDIPSTVSINFNVMSGEKLDFADDTFTHSLTNLGILFFVDAERGAREIYRTLKPGGTAIVTSWADLGYVDIVHRAQKVAKPGYPLFKVPIPEEWYQAIHVKSTLEDAGFDNVEVQEKVVYYGAEDIDGLLRFFTGLVGMLWVEWEEGEKEVLKNELRKAAEEAVVRFQRPVPGDASGGVNDLVGIPMTALVAVARK